MFVETARVFPGRFTAIDPAAVEVHATYSGFADEVRVVQVAPDKDAERPCDRRARGPVRRGGDGRENRTVRSLEHTATTVSGVGGCP